MDFAGIIMGVFTSLRLLLYGVVSRFLSPDISSRLPECYRGLLPPDSGGTERRASHGGLKFASSEENLSSHSRSVVG